MWKDHWVKAVKLFAIIPIYRTPILFNDGQGICKNFFNKALLVEVKIGEMEKGGRKIGEKMMFSLI